MNIKKKGMVVGLEVDHGENDCSSCLILSNSDASLNFELLLAIIIL